MDNYYTVNTARSLRPSIVPEGDASFDPTKAVRMVQHDAAKADKLFNLKYRSKLETARDMVEDFESRGWLN